MEQKGLKPKINIDQPINSPSEANGLIEVFIGGLPNDTVDADLLNLLSKHAKIVELNVKRRNNKKNKKCLGYAISKIEEKEAQNLIQLRYITYNNRRISLTKNLKGKELEEFQKRFAKRRLFIKDLPENTKPEFLKRTFSKFGALDSFYVRGQPGTKLKLGVVIFKERKSALAAFHFSMNKMIEELNKLGTKVEFDYRDMKKETEKHDPTNKKKKRKSKSPKINRKHFHKMVLKINPRKKKWKKSHHWIRPGMKNFDYFDFEVGHYKKNLFFSDNASRRVLF